MNTTKESRIEILKKNGLDVEKFYSLNIKPGTVVQIMINKNDNDTTNLEDLMDNPYVSIAKEIGSRINLDINDIGALDSIEKNIIENGYVRNSKLHRRFIMAQMFKMLNHKDGFTGALKEYSYDYTIRMLAEEIHVLNELKKSGDTETFNERVMFFDKESIINILDDYRDKVYKFINDEIKNHPRAASIHVKGFGKVKLDNIERLRTNLSNRINCIIHSVNLNDYSGMEKAIRNLYANRVILPNDTPKSKVWVDRFKAEGAYYTLKNLIIYHKCKLPPYYTINIDRDCKKIMDYTVKALKGNSGFMVLGLLKKTIEFNDFDFVKRMKEIYG